MKYSITQLQKEFSDNDACLDYIFKMRFPEAKGYYRIKNRKCYSHKTTRHQISPLVGTIFEKSSTPLTKWFVAMYLMATSKHGVSSNELKEKLGVTYKCAWRMNNKIRGLMQQEDSLFTGVVEADETYMGGHLKGGHAFKEKTPVLGVVKRGGGVRAKVSLEGAHTGAILKHLTDNVAFGSHVISDDNKIYRKVKRYGMFHDSVNHSKREFVRGNIHTNTIEGFWGQLKRSIDGTYHAVSKKHLQSYVDEFAYRYSHRHSEMPLFLMLLDVVVGKPDSESQRSVPLLVPVT